MIVIPAIDLKDGRCVRLRQGRAADVSVYSEDPVSMARAWVDQGAQYLHVVDLDGAFAGKPVHTAVIAGIAGAVKVPVEAGGGLRTEKDIAALVKAGVARAILGTRACAEPDSLAGFVKTFGAMIAVGIDARNGLVQIKGWVETTGIRATELARRAEAAGVRTIIYTDTATDGMLAGVNSGGVDAMCGTVACDVIASGGISSVGDIRALCALGRRNLRGAIVGKALYEGRISLPDLIACAGERRASPRPPRTAR